MGFRLTGRSPAWELVRFVLALGACIGFAWVFHKLIEAPSLALSRRIRLGSSEPATQGRGEAVAPASLAP